jgi:Flp pilus assembly protein TadG
MASRALRRRGRRDDGAAAVEFVLILPLFLVLLFGIMAFGLLLWTLVNANGAARESARLAAVGTPCNTWISDTQDRVKLAPVSLTSMSRTYSESPAQVGDTVTVTLNFATNDPNRGSLFAATAQFGAGVLLPNTFTVTAKSRVEVVSDPCTSP